MSINAIRIRRDRVIATAYVASIAGANYALAFLLPIMGDLSLLLVSVAIVPITFTLRDILHQLWGARIWKRMIALVALGGVISVVTVHAPDHLRLRIAVASFVAFFISELLDTLVYQRLQQHSWTVRAARSSVVSSLVDSALFITVAFGFNLYGIAVQTVGKVIGSIVFVMLVGTMRRGR